MLYLVIEAIHGAQEEGVLGTFLNRSEANKCAASYRAEAKADGNQHLITYRVDTLPVTGHAIDLRAFPVTHA